MSDGQWIEIVDWDRFQHYSDRVPIWIKNYLDLLHDDGYLSLTENQRATLHGLWLIYAASHRKVVNNTAKLSRQLAVRVTKRTLDALIDAGFIRLTASAPIAPRYLTDSLEVEVLRTSTKNARARARSNGRARTRAKEDTNSAPAVCPECGTGAGLHTEDCRAAIF